MAKRKRPLTPIFATLGLPQPAFPTIGGSVDDTWKCTYSSKPSWWDDETEPRCDECGVHVEEADDWCGNCGNCGKHDTCRKRHPAGYMHSDPLADWECGLLGIPPTFSSTEEAQHWLDTHSSGG